LSSLPQNWRKGQNRFCLEEREVAGSGSGWEAGRKNDPNNVYTYKCMNKEKKKKCRLILWLQMIVTGRKTLQMGN
jgi:hypothetical protein